MEQTRKKRLIVELAATALASPLLLLLLALTHAYGVLWWFAVPIIALRFNWIDHFFHPLESLGTSFHVDGIFLVDAILMWLWAWLQLMLVVKLIERLIIRRREIA
jgi:hypothetical protein